MLRAILELLLTIAVIAIARVVLISLMKGLSSTSFTSFQDGNTHAGQPRSSPEPPVAGLLHKDPICGTFVAESTRFRRQVGRETFFYCSEACQQRHSQATR